MTPTPQNPPAKQPNPFYLDVLRQEIANGGLKTTDKVLVTCGGNLDRITLLEAGFTDVVISNLAHHDDHLNYSPFSWEHQDIENLTYDDGAFDVAIVHSGLHHCFNPTRAMGELCRVARRTVIAFEPYETWLTRLGAKLGYGQQYEDQAVHGNRGESGGVANTEIPNYVYRFRELEVRKFARAFHPYAEPPVRFYRALRVNVGRFKLHRNPLLRVSFSFALPVIQMLSRLIPSFNNNLCFVIQKPGPEHFHEWIQDDSGRPRVNRDYLVAKYGRFRD
jgi:SAM-dependent methyltransferase